MRRSGSPAECALRGLPTAGCARNAGAGAMQFAVGGRHRQCGDASGHAHFHDLQRRDSDDHSIPSIACTSASYCHRASSVHGTDAQQNRALVLRAVRQHIGSEHTGFFRSTSDRGQKMPTEKSAQASPDFRRTAQQPERSASCSCRQRIFPVVDLGSSSRKVTKRGAL